MTQATAPEAKHLSLMRHAKSSWDDPDLDDHDRPLAKRGRKAARRIGVYLRDEQIPISLVLCSSARRARETFDLMTVGGELRVEGELYGASAAQLLERLHRVPDQFAGVMLIGHNPAIADLAIDLAADAGELAGRKFPTAALVTLTFTGAWKALEARQAELVAFVRPRELG